MIEFIIFSIAPLIIALLGMQTKLERGWLFLVSALLSVTISVAAFPLIQQKIAENGNAVALDLQMPLILSVLPLLLLAVFFIIFFLFVPPADCHIEYPEKWGTLLNFICFLAGSSAIMGVIALGLTSLPVCGKLPLCSQSGVAKFARASINHTLSFSCGGNPLNGAAETWLTRYPRYIYRISGGVISEESQEAAAPTTSPADTEGTVLNNLKQRIPNRENLDQE